jgi:hypothetical protein
MRPGDCGASSGRRDYDRPRLVAAELSQVKSEVLPGNRKDRAVSDAARETLNLDCLIASVYFEAPVGDRKRSGRPEELKAEVGVGQARSLAKEVSSP